MAIAPNLHDSTNSRADVVEDRLRHPSVPAAPVATSFCPEAVRAGYTPEKPMSMRAFFEVWIAEERAAVLLLVLADLLVQRLPAARRLQRSLSIPDQLVAEDARLRNWPREPESFSSTCSGTRYAPR